MYAKLLESLLTAGIDTKRAAAVIGLSEREFMKKATDGAFDFDDAFTLKRTLFPNMDIATLFERSEPLNA